MDVAAIAATIAALKAGFETGRAALGLVKDVQGVLPAGEKKEAVSRTLEEAERQLRLAEAQIAQALGFPLCTCTFPPPVMLKVGWRKVQDLGDQNIRVQQAKAGKVSPGISVHECPRCRQNDAADRTWTRTVSELPDAGTVA
jgi:hypothetical protein